MTIVLIDNGSLAPAAHLNLRRVARELSGQLQMPVQAVSWRHSDRIPPDELEGMPAATLAPWLRKQLRQGERDFIFVPFFISPQGAIGSALHEELEGIRRTDGHFGFEFTAGLATGDVIASIAADRIRETIAARALNRPRVIVVDHGGPSHSSAQLRNQLAEKIAGQLHAEIAGLAAASLEGAEHPHNHPLFADQLEMTGYDRGPVVIAPLFLSPGRHAGIDGDLVQIAQAAEKRYGSALSCYFTGLIGTHSAATRALADSLATTLASRGALTSSTKGKAPRE